VPTATPRCRRRARRSTILRAGHTGSPPSGVEVLDRFAAAMEQRSEQLTSLLSTQSGMPITISSQLEGAFPAILLRYYGKQIQEAVGVNPGQPVRQSHVGHPSADRRRGGDRAVELPAGAGVHEARRPLWPRGARWSSSRRPRRRWTASSSPRPPRRRACHPTSSTSCPAGASSAPISFRTLTWTASRSPDRPPRAHDREGVRAAAVPGEPGARRQVGGDCARRRRSAGSHGAAVRRVSDEQRADLPATQIGPRTSSRQRDRVEGYIAKGTAEGARVVVGGGRPESMERGWFVRPTIVADVKNSDTVAQEEIFGPVLSVIPYDSDEEAVAIANDSEYGIGGSVWTSDHARRLDRTAGADRDDRDQRLLQRSDGPVRRGRGQWPGSRARLRGDGPLPHRRVDLPRPQEAPPTAG
jgi:hypothetical protein